MKAEFANLMLMLAHADIVVATIKGRAVAIDTKMFRCAYETQGNHDFQPENSPVQSCIWCGHERTVVWT